MFFEKINKNVIFHDGEVKYNYNDLYRYVGYAQNTIKHRLSKPSTIGFCSKSSFFEIAAILAFLELGHKILFIPRKHLFHYETHEDFFQDVDLIVDMFEKDNIVNGRDKLLLKTDLFKESVINDISLETDEYKSGFLFFSSGTTGKPKSIEQKHKRLIHAAQQTLDRIWVDNRNFLLHRGNTINHLGIFTTTYLPALFGGDNINWYDHTDKEVIFSDLNPIYNATLIFPYQPDFDYNMFPFMEGTKIVTGGTTITEDFTKRLFNSEKVKYVYNVYGATEIITPIMWAINEKNENNIKFTEVLDGVEFEVNVFGFITCININIDGNVRERLPDVVRKINDDNQVHFLYKGRDKISIFRVFKQGINFNNNPPMISSLNLSEDELIQILELKLGTLNSPKPIVLINRVEIKKNYNFLIYDPILHKSLDDISLEELNEIIYLYHEVDKEYFLSPLINNKIPLNNLNEYNNGLKLDRGIIRKMVSNKMNNESLNKLL
jgi:hypothetical protein